MPSVITRLVTTANTVYERGQPWPGMVQDALPDNEKVKVHVITLLPEAEQVTTEGEGDDETDTGSETHPAQYEIWGLSDRTYAAIECDLGGKPLAPEEVQYLGNLKQAFRRTVYLRAVDYVDEEVDIGTALQLVELRQLGWMRRTLEEKQELVTQLKQEAEQAQRLQEQAQKTAEAAAQQATSGQNGQTVPTVPVAQ